MAGPGAAVGTEVVGGHLKSPPACSESGEGFMLAEGRGGEARPEKSMSVLHALGCSSPSQVTAPLPLVWVVLPFSHKLAPDPGLTRSGVSHPWLQRPAQRWAHGPSSINKHQTLTPNRGIRGRFSFCRDYGVGWESLEWLAGGSCSMCQESNQEESKVKRGRDTHFWFGGEPALGHA